MNETTKVFCNHECAKNVNFSYCGSNNNNFHEFDMDFHNRLNVIVGVNNAVKNRLLSIMHFFMNIR